MATFLRIWKMRGQRGRCRTCHKPLLWVIADDGKRKPFRLDAKPIRTETSAETGATFDVYESTAFHSTVCTAPKKRTAQQARLL